MSDVYVQIVPNMGQPEPELIQELVVLLGTIGKSETIARIVAATIVANQPELRPFEAQIAQAIETLLEELRDPTYGRFREYLQARREALLKVSRP